MRVRKLWMGKASSVSRCVFFFCALADGWAGPTGSRRLRTAGKVSSSNSNGASTLYWPMTKALSGFSALAFGEPFVPSIHHVTLIDNLDRAATILVTEVSAANAVIDAIGTFVLRYDPAS